MFLLNPRPLMLACLCVGASTSLAQRAAIAPLAPLAPVVALPVPGLGKPIQPMQPAAAALAAPTPSTARPPISEPVYLLNSRYIISSGMLSIKPRDIVKIDIYKGADTPDQLKGLVGNGIVNVTLNTRHKVRAKSLAVIKRELALTGPLSFQLDGQLVGPTSLPIATEAIEGVDVLRTSAGTVVNIRLTRAKPIVSPPGTIFIRGLAGK